VKSNSRKFLQRLVAYLLGAFLIGWGFWCFGYELLYPAEVVKEAVAANKVLFLFAPNMFCGVIICWGVILVLTAYYHYAGGIWTYLGAVLIGLSMMFAALTVDDYLTSGSSLQVLFICLAVVVFIFLLGCSGLVAGQIRHRHKQKKLPLTVN
jgi:membrane-bound ClpP family serine protease